MKRQFENLMSFEGRLDEKFAEMGALSERIDGTLKSSVEKILGDGAARIGAGMGDEIAAGAREILTPFGEYHALRGQTILVCFICVISAIAYRFGEARVLNAAPHGGAFEAFLFLPAGWSVFFCGTTYSFLWAGDHWGRIKKKTLYKIILGVQLFLLSMLAMALL
jgi:hypothetical protein